MTKEKSIESQLNELVTPYFQKLEKKLNKNFIKLELEPGDNYNLPLITDLGNYTMIPNNESGFKLEPFIVGNIKSISKKNSDRNAIIIRRLLGYANVCRLLKNPNSIDRYLKPLITEMLLTLENAIGFKYSTLNAGITGYAKFERQGCPKIYFSDCDNYAAMEIRLYSDTWSCIDLRNDK